ncbi:MAG: DUF4358 domain-containing protein [Ruminococcus sp.]|uniref:DUF4358 domain-containing protein n=1 Tax=Ruminococcus sp. TaxID=41978 RepID=UPI0025F5311A|nr:DUF4358 domain-containing protein [Ruminococcus sp.]MCR5539402.1 DUF4358 domain-containing protein [Ruminococcus sp.]
MTKKTIKTAAVIFAAMLMMCGCSANNKAKEDSPAANTEKAADITAEEMLADISSENLDGRISKGDGLYDKNAANFYGTGFANIIDGAILYNDNGGYADEVSAVKFDESVDGQELLKDRLESRTASFRDYRPEEVGKLEKAKIFNAGGFDVLIISDDADSIEKQIKDKLS